MMVLPEMVFPSASVQTAPKLTVLYRCPTIVSAVKPESPIQATLELNGSVAILVACVARTPNLVLVFRITVSSPVVASDQNPPSVLLLSTCKFPCVVLATSKATDPSRLLIASDHTGKTLSLGLTVLIVGGPNSRSSIEQKWSLQGQLPAPGTSLQLTPLKPPGEVKSVSDCNAQCAMPSVET